MALFDLTVKNAFLNTFKYIPSENQKCICGNSITDICNLCLEDGSIELPKCTVVTGNCNHSFHSHCLTNNNICAICSINWHVKTTTSLI